jgi:uncharacterized protein YkwD
VSAALKPAVYIRYARLMIAPAYTLFILPVLLFRPAPVWSETMPDRFLTSIEQQVFAELNHVRSDPKGYAEYLAEWRRHFNGNQLQRPGEMILITQEGAAAFDEAITFLRNTDPLPDLRLSKGLSLAARALVADQKDGATGHQGGDGSQPWQRMSRYGTWQEQVAENISYGGDTARGVVIQLIVDDGVPDRSHRMNMFAAQYRFVGIACGDHARFRNVCVMDYAVRYTEK